MVRLHRILSSRQVIDVVKMDVHLDYDVQGNRYIERMTEIVRTDKNMAYVHVDPLNVLASLAENQKRYYEKQTENRRFKAVDIMHFNKETWTYEVDNYFSAALTKHLLDRLPPEYVDEFIDWSAENWKEAS